MAGDTNGVAASGRIDEQAVASTLQDEVTVGYRPQLPLEAMWLSGTDMPNITFRRDIEFMQMHEVVQIALEYYRSGIAGAEFWGGPDPRDPDNPNGKPISPDPRVSMFVLAHAERFWNTGVPLLQEGYAYGWAPGEHVYKEVQYAGTNGYLVWSPLKGFHPTDSFILTLKHQPVGIRVKNIREREPADLWFASDRIPAKACWYAHRPRFDRFYGRSQLISAWRPWRRLVWRDGVEQVADAAVYRAGYCGPVVRFPPGHSAPTAMQGVPVTQKDGGGQSRREYRDVARQMSELAKSGASFALSSEKYPESAGGGYKWDVTWPEHVMDISPLLNAAGALEDRIMLGIGVPPELVKSGGTGSGYSGRSIPREAFLDGQQKVADAILALFVAQVLRPLVLWNFGDVPFSVCCKSLLQSQAANKQPNQGGLPPALPQPPAMPQQPPQMPPDGGMATPQAPPMLALSLEHERAERWRRVREIARRVRERRSA